MIEITGYVWFDSLLIVILVLMTTALFFKQMLRIFFSVYFDAKHAFLQRLMKGDKGNGKVTNKDPDPKRKGENGREKV